MPTPLASKRQKLNDASSKLLKPFVSPLRVPNLHATKSKQSEPLTAALPYLPSLAAHTTRGTPSLSSIIGTKSVSVETTLSRSTPARKPTRLSTYSKPFDATELAVKKEINLLEHQIRQAQKDIDALQQAEEISRSSTNARLEALSKKWQLASQAVAEELFTDVKQRVEQMGGVSAWRESEKRKHGYMNGWEESGTERSAREKAVVDYEYDSRDDSLLEEQGRRRSGASRAQQRAVNDADDKVRSDCEAASECEQHGSNADDNEDDEDHFTMQMMLRSLNIELDVIGYDKQAETWTS